MQRLVVELAISYLSSLDAQSLAGKYDLLEVIHYLKFGPEGFAGICRIRLGPGVRFDEVSKSSNHHFEMLSMEGDNIVVYLEFRPIITNCKMLDKVLLSAPPEIGRGLIRFTVLGDAEGIRNMLGEIEKSGVRYKIIALTDAKFPPNTPISVLTNRQRQILLEAYDQGYYDVPRRISSAELAVRLKIDKSTVVEHLRKAENRLVSQIVGAR